MKPDLVGYLWNLLEPAERRQVEEALRADPELRRELDDLRRALGFLDEARDAAPAPPPGLADRTLAFVDAANPSLPSLPRSAPGAAFGGSGGRSWWRRLDVAVAASMALTLLGVMIPGVFALRAQSGRIECQHHLRSLGDGLSAYASQRGSYPDVASANAPRPVAGLVIPMLLDAGVLSSPDLGNCPATAWATSAGPWTMRELRWLSGERFERVAVRLLPGYAYSLGFRDDAGRVRPCDAMMEDRASPFVAVLADAPDVPASEGNSPNHQGLGQNILFLDGAVRFQTSRTVGRDDVYLNRARQVGAGLGCADSVLGTSASAP